MLPSLQHTKGERYNIRRVSGARAPGRVPSRRHRRLQRPPKPAAEVGARTCPSTPKARARPCARAPPGGPPRASGTRAVPHGRSGPRKHASRQGASAGAPRASHAAGGRLRPAGAPLRRFRRPSEPGGRRERFGPERAGGPSARRPERPARGPRHAPAAAARAAARGPARLERRRRPFSVRFRDGPVARAARRPAARFAPAAGGGPGAPLARQWARRAALLAASRAPRNLCGVRAAPRARLSELSFREAREKNPISRWSTGGVVREWAGGEQSGPTDWHTSGA